MTSPLNVPAGVVHPWPNPVEHVGYVVGGRYQLEERVARGAMGSIWRARHVELKSAVAVKFLDVSVARETDMHGRFLQEARSAAAVRCAHVVQVFDYGRESDVPFIVMELLEGETLEQRLARRGVMPPRELDKIFREVACGISRAHATGVVHRDLKPSNIFIASEGPVEVTKLIDFGIAKVDETRLGFTPRAGTRAGTVIGTPEYMSPEQLRAGADIDRSVDLWALAIVAFECLTGKLPFTGNSLTDLVVQICTEKPTAPSALARVPPGFDRWFAKATHRDLQTRYGSAEEMAEALSAILQSAPAEEPRELVPVRGPSTGTLMLGSVLRDTRSRLRPLLARWAWLQKAHRELVSWLSPMRAGSVALALGATAFVIAFWPAPMPKLPPASSAAQLEAPSSMVQHLEAPPTAQVEARVNAPTDPPLAAPVSSSPSSSSSSTVAASENPAAPTLAAAAAAAAPAATAPFPAEVALGATPPVTTASATPSAPPKPRARSTPRPASPAPARAVASSRPAEGSAKPSAEQATAASRAAAPPAGNGGAAGQPSPPAKASANVSPLSKDAESLFAERL